ncbi:MAG: DNA repair protein RecO [Burkholderiales bacterium]
MATPNSQRIEAEPALVLHGYPFRETSLIVELFARHYGRIALVARGARRPKSAMRGLLLAFQPMDFSWFGKGELRTLHKVEWQAVQPQLTGTGLLCGFYLNELLMRFMQRDDAHEDLFDYYLNTVQALRSISPGTGDALRSYAVQLRGFEVHLLRELGYGLMLKHEAKNGDAIDPERSYDYFPELGPVVSNGVAIASNVNGLKLSGRTLLDMANDDYSHAQTVTQAKQLMRMVIGHHLGGEELNTRQLMRDLQQL